MSVPITSLPEWINRYIGIPYLEDGYDRDGCNCWGLFRMVLKEQADVDLPVHDEVRYLEVGDVKRIARAVQNDLAHYGWLEINEEETRCLDAILIKYFGQPIHVGIVVAKGWMLHTQEGIESVLEEYDTYVYMNRREGFYRYVGTN